MKETVEEFLKRGGEIKQIPRGEGAHQIRMKRSTGSHQRVTYVANKNAPVFNDQGKYKKT